MFVPEGPVMFPAVLITTEGPFTEFAGLKAPTYWTLIGAVGRPRMIFEFVEIV
jgi:hypothetical protein